MASRLQLEVFETENRAPDAVVVMDGSELEEARLASFESGYKAGWDDAVAAQSDDQAQVRADIARTLQGLSFTYHEARSHVLRALAPLIRDIAAQLLPRIARASLPHLVSEALAPYAELAAEAPLRLYIHPVSRPAVEALIGQEPGLPLTVIEEPTLSEGQAWLRLGDSETRIDLDGALAAIQSALDDFFSLAAKDLPNGRTDPL